MNVTYIGTNYEKELGEILSLFFPTFEKQDDHTIVFEKTETENKITIDENTYTFPKTNLKEKNDEKRAFYLALSKHFNKTFEWGSITGVRPTKLAYDLLEN